MFSSDKMPQYLLINIQSVIGAGEKFTRVYNIIIIIIFFIVYSFNNNSKCNK